MARENTLTREMSEATSSTHDNEPVSCSDVGVENSLTCQKITKLKGLADLVSRHPSA